MMNLMFWKKKSAPAAGEEGTQEDASDKAEEQKSSDADSADQNESDAQSAKKPGLIARLKAGIASLTHRSKKTAAPDAEEGKDSDADEHRRSKRESEDDSDTEPETSKKPGFFARIKASLFGAKKAEEEDEEEAERRPAKHEAEHATPAPAAEETVEPEHSWTGWLIGGAVLLLILLAAGGYFALDYILPPLKSSKIQHDVVRASRNRSQAPPVDPMQQTEPTPAEPAQAPQTEPAPAAPAEAAPQTVQPPPVQPAQPVQPPKQAAKPAGNPPPAADDGDLVVGHKSAKETAMSLKEAIKAMNGEPEAPAKKPAK